MQNILFISDLHLSADTPHTLRQLEDLIQKQGGDTKALYILGDLFEAWLGDDQSAEWIEKIKNLFRSANFPIYYMIGNRDFLAGEKFAEDCHIQFIKEPCILDLFGKKTLLLHGDVLCTDDKGHQKWRKIYLSRWFAWLAYHIPVSWRVAVANCLRRHSNRTKKTKNAQIMDVNAIAVEKIMQQYQVDLLIHGHTHLPAIHSLNDGKTRIVLAAWHHQGNCLIYYQNHQKHLNYF